MRKLPWKAHWVSRFFERKEFHPPTVTARDPGIAEEHSDRELLQLRSADRPWRFANVRALRLSCFHSRYETTAAIAGRTAECRGAEADGPAAAGEARACKTQRGSFFGPVTFRSRMVE